MPEYGRKSYWDERYAEEATGFDWLFDYASIQGNLGLVMRPTDRVLVVGCGNAAFSGELARAGFTKSVHIDNSEVVIRQMRKRYPNVDFRVMNVLDLDFPDGTFDVVLDKSLLDTLLCYDESARRVTEMIWEVHRVLKAGGRYVSMSLHGAKEILGYFSSAFDNPVSDKVEEEEPLPPPTDWQVDWCRVQNPRWNEGEGSDRSIAHSFVVCTKTPREVHKPLNFVEELSDAGEAELELRVAKRAEHRWRDSLFEGVPVEELAEYLDAALALSLRLKQ